MREVRTIIRKTMHAIGISQSTRTRSRARVWSTPAASGASGNKKPSGLEQERLIIGAQVLE